MSTVHVDVSITSDTWVNESRLHGNCVTLNIAGVAFHCHDEAQLTEVLRELTRARNMLLKLRAEQPEPVEPDRGES